MAWNDHQFRRRVLLQAGLAACASGGATLALAQATTARIIVPAAAGGATDLLSRLYAQWLAEEWGRPVVAENRPGAGGVIGSQIVAKAPPDGNTLMLGALSHVANSGMMDNVPYDPIKDFTPVAKLLTFASSERREFSTRAWASAARRASNSAARRSSAVIARSTVLRTRPVAVLSSARAWFTTSGGRASV